MKNIERNNVLLYSLGSLVSNLGSTIYSFAIGLYVLNITGSGMQFAMTLIVSLIPAIILTPFAGVLADKFDKKKIVVRMDLLNGVLFIGFFLWISKFGISVFSIYVTTFMTNFITNILR